MVITPLSELCWMQNNMCDTLWSEFKELDGVYIVYN
jgi:hypothetical protein